MKRLLPSWRLLFFFFFFLMFLGWSSVANAESKDLKDGELFQVINLSPADKAVNVPINILCLQATFIYSAKKDCDTANFSFTVTSEDGTHILHPKSYFDDYEKDSVRVYCMCELLRPNTKYFVKIKGIIIAQVTNEINWSFTTGNWHRISFARFPNDMEWASLSQGDVFSASIYGTDLYKDCKLILRKKDTNSSISLNAFKGDSEYELEFEIPSSIEPGVYKFDFWIKEVKALREDHPNWEVDIRKAVEDPLMEFFDD